MTTCTCPCHVVSDGSLCSECRVRGIDRSPEHPMWSDGQPMLCGDLVHNLNTDLTPCEEAPFTGVILSIHPDEITIGGTTVDDEEWDEQPAPSDLIRVRRATTASVDNDSSSDPSREDLLHG